MTTLLLPNDYIPFDTPTLGTQGGPSDTKWMRPFYNVMNAMVWPRTDIVHTFTTAKDNYVIEAMMPKVRYNPISGYFGKHVRFFVPVDYAGAQMPPAHMKAADAAQQLLVGRPYDVGFIGWMLTNLPPRYAWNMLKRPYDPKSWPIDCRKLPDIGPGSCICTEASDDTYEFAVWACIRCQSLFISEPGKVIEVRPVPCPTCGESDRVYSMWDPSPDSPGTPASIELAYKEKRLKLVEEWFPDYSIVRYR